MIEQAVPTDLLQQFVVRAGTLYSLPAVAVEVLDLTAEPRVDTQALKACVERDPALTGKLLRVVNSSLFGMTREVSDLQQALTRLGVKPLKLMALGFSLPVGLFSGIEAQALRRYWQYTLLKAVAARELCQSYWKDAGDEAFVAGLLQDIGALVLVQELGDSYLNFLHSVHEQGADLLAMERAALGFDHVELSGQLLDHWNLPTSIVDAVIAPHDPAQLAQREAQESPLPQILHLATLIASIIVDRQHQRMPELLKAAYRFRALTVDQIDQLVGQMQERVELMANVFAVEVDLQESYREIMARAYAQMSQVAEEALPELIEGGRQQVGEDESRELNQAIGRFARGLAPQPVPNRRHATAPPPPPPPPPESQVATSHDPGLNGRIQAILGACRGRQCECSLVLLEIDDYVQLVGREGAPRATQVIAAAQQGIEMLSDHPCDCLLVGEARYAILLPGCDRLQAVAVARNLVNHLPDWILEQMHLSVPMTASAGVATLTMATRSFHPKDLVNAADRCLFAARSSGGGTVKSIDVLS